MADSLAPEAVTMMMGMCASLPDLFQNIHAIDRWDADVENHAGKPAGADRLQAP